MSLFTLKPSHKPVKDYYAALKSFQDQGHKTEGNLRPEFAALLRRVCQDFRWHLVEEYPFKGTEKQPLTDLGESDIDWPYVERELREKGVFRLA